MSSGKMRYGEEDKIPLEKPVWGIIVWAEKGKIREEVIHFSSSNNPSISERLQEMSSKDALYIVWHGSWNTDVFKCDPKKIAQRLAEVQ